MSRNSESRIRGAYCYGFNGKDRESEFSSGAYDFGARIHDARLGRWMSVDNSYDHYPGWSPYTFAYSSPIVYLDPDGNDPILALVEAISAMGIEIGLQILPDLLSGEDFSKCFEQIKWGDVLAEGAETFISSFFFSGRGISGKIYNLQKSKGGKLLIEFITTLTKDMMAEYWNGTFNDEDGDLDFDKVMSQFPQIAEVAAYKALLNSGDKGKAKSLFDKVGRKNQRMMKEYAKLQKAIDKGSSQKTIDRRIEKLSKAQKEFVNETAKAAKKQANKKIRSKLKDYGAKQTQKIRKSHASF